MASRRRSAAAAGSPPLSYRLLIWLERPVDIRVGALGLQRFEAGLYCYTGSARRNPVARLRRHLSREKRLRWHIDYLLATPGASVVDVEVHRRAECALNQAVGGRLPVPGLGASDCAAACGSHLRYLGTHPWSRLEVDG